MTRLGGLVGLGLILVATAGAVEVDLPRYPSLSPDGTTLVFSWRGDLWRAPSRGGHAERLTRDVASDARSAWSPDGTQIAFDSERSGVLNLWVMQADGSGLRQVTHSDVGIALAGWNPAGTHLLASAGFEGDVYRGARPYRVPVAGGPVTRLIDAFGVSPQLSADGRVLAFVRGASRWTRRHYQGPDAREVWLYDTQGKTFSRLTTYPGNDGKPRWLDGNTLLFLSDRDGTANVWVRDVRQGEPRQATRFTDADVTAFDVARDGSWAVAVSWDGLYGWDPRDPAATPTRLALSAPDDGPPRFKRVAAGGKVSEVALHPFGEAVALVAYGRVFVRGLGDHDSALTVSAGPDRASGVSWSPDGTALYFVSDRDGSDSIYRARVTRARRDVLEAYKSAVPNATPLALDGEESDTEQEPENDPGAEPKPLSGKEFAGRWKTALAVEVEGVVVTPHNDRGPSLGPKGRWLAFQRGRGDLVLRDLGVAAGAPGAERVLLASWDSRLSWAWSPDARHLAYAVQDRAFNSDVFVVPVDGSAEAVNVSMHPNDDFRPCWSADGKTLAFLSARDSDEADVWKVNLDRRLDGMNPAETAAYRERLQKLELSPPSVAEVASAAVAAPDTQARPLDLADAYLRLERVTEWRGDEGDLALVPTGVVVSEGSVDGKRTLFHVDHEGERTELGKDASLSSLSWDQTTLLLVQGGRGAQVPATGGKLERIPFSADLDVDRVAESSQKFREAARVLGEVFYHPTLKGLDWAKLSERYHSLALRSRTAAEFREVANRFIGELNASHLGISPPTERAETFQPNGRLGVDVREEPSGALVTRVLAQGPAATAPTPLQVGDRIVAVRGLPWAAHDTLEARLRGRVGKETLLEVERPVADGAPLKLGALLTPIAYRSERTLRYQAWTTARRDRVHELSRGRVGYLHIRGMNYPSLMEFERDLFAAAYGRKGLLIDVRNNGGGWTADRVLGALMARPHAYTVPRGADPAYTRGYPQGRLYIQRYTDPVNMLCNEKSFSNAEILSHAFRTHNRGTLVGEQTYGGVISTGGMALLDGTFVRLPFRGWYLLDGTDMENNGAVPHLRVPQTPEDESAGIDRQLQIAVEDLLERLDTPK